MLKVTPVAKSFGYAFSVTDITTPNAAANKF